MIDQTTLVVFGATWCKDCQSVKKLLDEQAVNFTYLDIGTTVGIKASKELELRSIPAAFDNGVHVFSGINQCRSWLKRHKFEVPKEAQPQPVLAQDIVNYANQGNLVLGDEVFNPPDFVRQNAVRVNRAKPVRVPAQRPQNDIDDIPEADIQAMLRDRIAQHNEMQEAGMEVNNVRF